MLKIAVGQEYRVLGVQEWLAQETPCSGRPLLLLRHDVDQAPGAALRMARAESDHGLTSTWYFRWRTANPRVLEALAEQGNSVGLHYETLSRMLLERGLGADRAPELVDEAREQLAAELAAFGQRFGPTRSACPHGDTRVPGVHNGLLLKGENLSDYGLRWDVNDAVGKRGIDLWLTDRSRAEGSWKDGLDAVDAIIDRRSPLMLVLHPHNWLSGPALWWDRLAPGGTRTVSDDPGLASASPQRERSGA